MRPQTARRTRPTQETPKKKKSTGLIQVKRHVDFRPDSPDFFSKSQLEARARFGYDSDSNEDQFMLSPPDTPPSPPACKQLVLPEPPCDQQPQCDPQPQCDQQPQSHQQLSYDQQPLSQQQPSCDQQPDQLQLDKVAQLKQVEAEIEKHIDRLLEVQDKFARDIKYARECLLQARNEIAKLTT